MMNRILQGVYLFSSLCLSSSVALAWTAPGTPCKVVRRRIVHHPSETYTKIGDRMSDPIPDLGAMPQQPSGVPNYRGRNFYESGHCGPTAAMEIIGFWDANGWPCLVRNSPPYVQRYYTWDGASMVRTADDYPSYLYDLDEIIMDHVGMGGKATSAINYGDEIVEAIQSENPDTADWSGDDMRDETRIPNWIKTEITEGRPYIYLVKTADAELEWDDGRLQAVNWHYMACFGYEETATGAWDGLRCAARDRDYRWLCRSGWRDGGDTYVWVPHHDRGRVVFRIVPSGRSRCEDHIDQDDDGYNAQEVNGSSRGITPGDDCDDLNPDIHPGAEEVCDGVDNDCSGRADDGPDDLDGDHLRDACDPDTDGDGIDDGVDTCGSPPQDCSRDRDNDTIPDETDRCRADASSPWVDCSRDADNDTVSDTTDNCRERFNPGQGDCDHDGQGNACDADVSEPCVEIVDVTEVCLVRAPPFGSCPLFNRAYDVMLAPWGFEGQPIAATFCGGFDINDSGLRTHEEQCYDAGAPLGWVPITWESCPGFDAITDAPPACPPLPAEADGERRTIRWLAGPQMEIQALELNDATSTSGKSYNFYLNMAPESGDNLVHELITIRPSSNQAMQGRYAGMLQAEAVRHEILLMQTLKETPLPPELRDPCPWCAW